MILCRFVPTLVVATTLSLCGCAAAPPVPSEPMTAPAPGSVLASIAIDRAAADRVLALNPEHISEADVRDTLSAVPAPRIVLLHGGIYPVYALMVSFGHFLTGMGYPEARIRDPRNGDWSRSPYEDASRLTGLVAWYYEHEAMQPMMIGHSQGGIQAIKVLRTLNGAFGSAVEVWDPLTDTGADRSHIVDPYTGKERPVVGLSLSYVSVVGAGGAALLLPNQWSMIGHMYSVPDTVDEFTGFTIKLDPIAWGGQSPDQYRHEGTAEVRNVPLPAGYSHIFVPLTEDLAQDPVSRNWISAYAPAATGDVKDPPPEVGANALWAADVWYSIKKHWCLEAQRLIRAQRAKVETPAGAADGVPAQPPPEPHKERVK